LTVIRPEVELMVTAGEIPESIEVDLSNLSVGDAVTISSVTLPSGTKAIIDRDFVIATIQAPSSLKSSGTDDDDDAEVVEGSEESDDKAEGAED